MTRAEWNLRERARNRAAGKCRCGRKRVAKRVQCLACITYDRERRERATAAGYCSGCRARRPAPGARWCKVCRGKQLRHRREADAALRDAQDGPTVAQALRGMEPGSMDVEMAVLLVASVLERLERPDEADALKLQLGEMMMRTGLHALEHPGPVHLGEAVHKALKVTNRGTDRGIRTNGGQNGS